MATIKIYGASDDLVEIEGAIAGCDEYDFYRDEPDPDKRWGYIATSDGSVIRIGYGVDDTACWRVEVERQGAAATHKTQTGDDEAEGPGPIGSPPPYSDVLAVAGVEWVKFTGKSRANAYKAAGVVMQ